MSSDALVRRTEPHAEAFAVAAARSGGLMKGRTLRSLGISAHAFGILVRSGELVSVRRGVYVRGEVWVAASVDERYRMSVVAASLASASPIIASHLSAAAFHGLPLIGRWPMTVHVATPGASGGSSSKLFTAHRSGPSDDPVMVNGSAATPLLRTLIDVASTQSFLVAVTMCDHVLYCERKRAAAASVWQLQQQPVITQFELFEELERVNPRKGRRQAERAIGFATDQSESPGESLSRVRMLELGFEVPDLQERFVDANGDERRTDFFWKKIRKIGEFDGLGKYMRGGLTDGASAAGKVMQEKRREDALRPLVNSFTRWEWSVCISPYLFARFLREHDVPLA